MRYKALDPDPYYWPKGKVLTVIGSQSGVAFLLHSPVNISYRVRQYYIRFWTDRITNRTNLQSNPTVVDSIDEDLLKEQGQAVHKSEVSDK